MINIPTVEYRRPNGHRVEGSFEVFGPPGLTEKLQLMDSLGVEITLEAMQGMVNVCFDDGDFDYKFLLLPQGPELLERLVKEIMAFERDEYLEARALAVG